MTATLRFCACSLLALALGACSSTKSGAQLRKQGYDRILTAIKPGMYRRQLYALLPPVTKPQAQPPALFAVAGVAIYSEHQERHFLDDECYLLVRYQLKDGSEYARASFTSSQDQRRKHRPGSSDSIDRLLEDAQTFVAPWTPSRGNPDDIITDISTTLIPTDPTRMIGFGATPFPTQEGFRFGRAMPRAEPASFALQVKGGDDFPMLLAPHSPAASPPSLLKGP